MTASALGPDRGNKGVGGALRPSARTMTHGTNVNQRVFVVIAAGVVWRRRCVKTFTRGITFADASKTFVPES